MPVGFDPLKAVLDAVGIVCELDPQSLSGSTRFDDVGADSLARVSIADLVEARAAESVGALHIDDASLCRMTTLSQLAEFAAEHVGAPHPARIAS